MRMMAAEDAKRIKEMEATRCELHAHDDATDSS